MKKCRSVGMYALWCFTTVILCSNSFAHGIYIPNDTYPLSDYQEYGMVFEPHHQRVIDSLTKKLLEAERQNGHWAGARQEDVYPVEGQEILCPSARCIPWKSRRR